MQRLVSSRPIRARDERHSFARLAVMDMTDQPEIPCRSNNGSAQRPKMNGEDEGRRSWAQSRRQKTRKFFREDPEKSQTQSRLWETSIRAEITEHASP